MQFLFGKKKTPAGAGPRQLVPVGKEMLRENKRMLDRAIRELDRERMTLQNEEKKVIIQIKKAAREGQMDAVKIMAKSLVRNRHAVTKMYACKGQLQAVSLRLTTLKSTQAMSDAMRGATRAMGAMSKNMNLPQLQKSMREFEMQNEKMEMTSEMMGDAVDDAFEAEDEEEETDQLVNSVLDEIGISLDEQLVNAPRKQAAPAKVGAPAAAQQAAPMAAGEAPAGAGSAGLDDDLQARLDKLRKS